MEELTPRSASLLAYSVLSGTLTTLIIQSLIRQYLACGRSTPRGLPLFASLSLLSVSVTWFYMLSFFRTSYTSHVFTLLETALHTPHPTALNPSIASWLAATPPLFRHVWENCVDTPLRWWWGQQIFFATAAWALYLGLEGRRRGIPHLWAYLAVGELVAVCFAVNMFFCAVLLWPVEAKRENGRRMSWWVEKVYTPLYLATMAATYKVHAMAHTSWFLPTLLAPHVLLFAPVAVFPRREGGSEEREYWARLYRFVILGSLGGHAFAWKKVIEAVGIYDAPKELFSTLLWDNEAMSSIGTDVVITGLSVGLWMGLHGREWRGFGPVSGIEQGWWAAGKGWIGMILGSCGVVAGGFASELEGTGGMPVGKI